MKNKILKKFNVSLPVQLHTMQWPNAKLYRSHPASE